MKTIQENNLSTNIAKVSFSYTPEGFEALASHALKVSRLIPKFIKKLYPVGSSVHYLKQGRLCFGDVLKQGYGGQLLVKNRNTSVSYFIDYVAILAAQQRMKKEKDEDVKKRKFFRQI